MFSGPRVMIIGAALCLGLVGCGQHNKHAHQHDGVNMAGISDRAGFNGKGLSGEQAQLHAHRTFRFEFDRYDVSGTDYPAVRHHAEYLARHPSAHVRVEGHTDERGSREYNIGLGERRAKSVTDILLTEGANPDQVSVVSYGKEKPALHGISDDAHRMNRRAVLVYEE